MIGPDGARLSKRHRAATLADRDEPIGATLALLARTLGLATDGERLATARELLDGFDPERLPAGPVTLG